LEGPKTCLAKPEIEYLCRVRGDLQLSAWAIARDVGPYNTIVTFLIPAMANPISHVAKGSLILVLRLEEGRRRDHKILHPQMPELIQIRVYKPL
jgi:hypothetical protein